MDNDITKKINSISIRTLKFIPEGETQEIAYQRLVLSFIYAGNKKEIIVRLEKDQLLVLETLPETDDFIPELTPTVRNQD